MMIQEAFTIIEQALKVLNTRQIIMEIVLAMVVIYLIFKDKK